ncbi:unnamed protein product [Adineta steineri]|uniref:ADP ribosyltransferase domain-containing protein n=1 Tax=Adineta steineri TaxID=433720 RepID=A0A819CLH0_9BILA|nr:unnamed protein product [Adineta steineri]CAF3821958.1 unnamed protein product [Adineta steineri]
MHRLEKQSYVFNLFNQKQKSTTDLSREGAAFMWHQLLIHVLRQMLETESLKSKDKGALTVYRGQQIPNEEFTKLQQSIGKLIAANGFFSASREKEVSIIYAGESSDEMTAVLFEIQADPSLRSITLADIHQISEFTEEQEVLFSLGATFHIDSIVFDAELSLWKVQLKSTDDGWERVQEYMQLAEDEMKDTSPMIYFGSLLLHELGQVEQAEKYFQVLLKTLPSDHVDISSLKIGLGHIHIKRGDYRLALQEYEQAYKIRQDNLSVLHPRIATSLRNFGNTYRAMGDFDQALFYFREAMKINERNYLTDHICVAMTFEEIGLTFQGKAQWETALVWFEDALEIFKRILPSRHPQIAQCLGYIGNSYRYMKQFDCALGYFRQELEMDEQCLPSDHGHVINDLSRIVDTYRAMHAYDQGLQFCREKLAVYRELFGEHHPRFVNTLLRIVCS